MELVGPDTSDRRLRDAVAALQRDDTLFTTASVTLTAANKTTVVDTRGGSVTLTLPPVVTHLGHSFTIKKLYAANTVTVVPSGSDTIDLAASFAFTTALQAITCKPALVGTPRTYGYIVT
jgi:hypothetical protein